MTAPVRTQPKPVGRFKRLVLGNNKMTYANFVDVFADVFGDRTIFYLDRDIAFRGYGPRELTYHSLASIVRKLSNVLRGMGITPGDRVVLLTLNRVEGVLVGWAIARIGAIPVPLNYMLRAREVEQAMSKSGAEVLLCDSLTFRENLHGDVDALAAARTVALIDVDADSVPEGAVSIPALFESTSERGAPYNRTDSEETALIFFTSGTSGFPKGAALPDRAVMVGVRSMSLLTALGPAPKKALAVLVMPVAHAGGFAQMMMNYAMGSPMMFVSKFDPKLILDLIEEHRATEFTGAPVMYRMLEEAGAAERDLSSVEIWGGGADAFDDDLVRRFRKYGGRRLFGLMPLFVRGYGMAECNSWLAMSPPFPAGERCVGWTLPGVKTRIIDPETEEDVPKGAPGELLVRGRSVMREYWGDPDKTASAFHRDWFRTGDIVRRGKWGMLFFEDRSSDLIKAGGYKVASSEVEKVLAEHPAIDQCAVVGLAHKVKGQVPVAAVTVVPGAVFDEDEALAWIRARLAPYKCPRHIYVLESFPVTFSMKPKKADIRKLLEAEVTIDG